MLYTKIIKYLNGTLFHHKAYVLLVRESILLVKGTRKTIMKSKNFFVGGHNWQCSGIIFGSAHKNFSYQFWGIVGHMWCGKLNWIGYIQNKYPTHCMQNKIKKLKMKKETATNQKQPSNGNNIFAPYILIRGWYLKYKENLYNSKPKMWLIQKNI